jgi:adhesin/invasin
MFSVIMISRINTAVLVLFAAALTVTAACQKVPLLAPSGSTITLTSAATALSLNGTATIIAQVIQASGTSPQSGTTVIFTTTLGSIQPSQAETDVNGLVTVKFVAGGASGTATITATSGGANEGANGGIKILVGTAAVGRVTVSASPASVPAQGGSSRITAAVFDVNGNALTSAPVSFTTTAGSLSSAVVTTDANGLASTTLTTSQLATVTASVGAQATTGTGTGTGTGTTTTSATGQASGQVIVTISTAPTLVITPPTTQPTAGLPATFTFAVTAATTNGSAVRDVTVNWGDGQTQDLGALTGTATVSHVYRAAGVYAINATITDSSGNSVQVSTTVNVTATSIGLTITPPTTPPSAGLPAIFTIVVGTLPAGDVVLNVHITWGDGSAQDLGAITGSSSVAHPYAAAGSYIVAAVLTDTAGNSVPVSTAVTVVATASTTINITPPVVPLVFTYPFVAQFTVQVAPPTGVGIVDAKIDFGDNVHTQDLGGLNGTAVVSSQYAAAGTYRVIVTVVDTLGRTNTGSVILVLPTQ